MADVKRKRSTSKPRIVHLRGYFVLTACHRCAADLVVVYRFARGHRRCKQCDRRVKGKGNG